MEIQIRGVYSNIQYAHNVDLLLLDYETRNQSNTDSHSIHTIFPSNMFSFEVKFLIN